MPVTSTPVGASSGEPPHVTVTIDWDALRTRRDGLRASNQRQRCPPPGLRLQLIPVVLGSDSEPLDVGRAMRIVPLGIRRALLSETADAASRAAIDHPESAPRTTCGTGSSLARPRWEIVASCARCTTNKCTCKAGISPSTADASNSHPPKSLTQTADPSPTHSATDRCRRALTAGSGDGSLRGCWLTSAAAGRRALDRRHAQCPPG
jgi:hypothetical protein